MLAFRQESCIDASRSVPVLIYEQVSQIIGCRQLMAASYVYLNVLRDCEGNNKVLTEFCLFILCMPIKMYLINNRI